MIPFNKTKLNLFTISVISLSIWAVFFFIWVYKSNQAPDEGSILAKVELAIQMATVYILVQQYKISRIRNPDINNRLLLFWIVINSWLIFVDVCFYVAAYLSDTYLQSLSNLSFILYYLPCAIYATLTIIFLAFIILKKMLLNNKSAWKNISYLIILSFVIFRLYLSAVHYAYPAFSFQNTLQILLLFTEFMLFDLCIIGMIYAINIQAFILLIGIISLIIGDFLLTYTYVSQVVTRYFIIGEYFWCLGLIILFLSALSIKEKQSFFINDWFRSDNAIKSRVGLYVYFISISSFLAIYGLSYYLGLMKQEFLVIFPVLTMLYSIIVVIYSVVISQNFAEPFQKISKVIDNTINSEEILQEKNAFDIDEFNNLQQVLSESMQAVKIKEKANQLYVAFGNISANAVHSLSSPLASLRGATQNLKYSLSKSNDLDNLNNLELASTRIEEIVTDVLEQYRSLPSAAINEICLHDDPNQPRFINLVKIMKNVINLKFNEWANNHCHINLLTELDYAYFYLSPNKIKTVLSDLLNNSYESLDKPTRQITIIMNINIEYINIIINDTGCGIASDKLSSVLNGTSTKHNGKGLGLSHAKSYINSIGGNIRISSEYGQTTTIAIEIPAKHAPQWFTHTIKYQSNTVLIMLDDDINMHYTIQSKLRKVSSIQSHHYIEVDEYLKQVQTLNSHDNLLFIIDLHLNNSQWNGLQIIQALLDKNVKPVNIYLMTSDCYKLEIQNFVENHNVNLIPKDALDKLNLQMF